MKHHLRRRPEQRLQCLRCRAAFTDETSAQRSTFPCPDEPLAHGLLGQREHIRYPTWSKDRSCAAWNCPDPDPSHNWHGPDPYCDESPCPTCLHNCDCDVCEGRVRAPGLYRLVDSLEG
ncbi:hypothetical protein GCM10010211_48610 [Streptomyces albospinus]|uniref:Uncharacterized protein n=1 Tax=Streptomyces albospinus TaxID=285515 RepID=A0ABQ2VAG8_9ACTN|nr:hypothetical protein GCM10010211_48610 [Streptomyces albospinus]